ncbi:MAG: hypothetical protein E7Z93_06770 [Cyanobacteria bacterium SIG32]|nr:hypothetical protein [Cyanobacteria bacterium SIG32]
MKTILNIISYLAILGVIYVAIINAPQMINIALLTKDMILALGLQDVSVINKTLNLASYTLITLVVGLFTGICLIGQLYLSEKNKLNAYKRELEKSSVSNSSNSSKVQVLEAKIATLEKALDDALNR